MARLTPDLIIDRLRSNLAAAGLEVSGEEIAKMEELGCLKPVLAFEESEDPGDDELPDYLAARDPDAPFVGRGPGPASPGVTASGTDGGAARRDGPGRAGDAASALDLPIREVSALLARGELSPVELVSASLARIAALDPGINAFQLVLRDEALEAARNAERELREGRRRGPLQGVPVAVKDLLDLAGAPTTAGSGIWADRAAAADSTAVARLRAAGAVIVGKTRMSEFAYSPGSNNDHYGPTRNPADPSRDSGGSSSGSAAAVASGMVMAALGTDTGGSIRIPASYCGIVGYKPGFGELGLGGARSLAWSLDHLGPLSRDADGAALVAGALAGPDPRDPRTCGRGSGPAFPASRLDSPKGLRIGLLPLREGGKALASDEAAAAWRRSLEPFEAGGAALVELDFPWLPRLRMLNATILAIEAAQIHLAPMRERRADYGEFTRLRLLAGWAYGPTALARAEAMRLAARRECEAAFASVDLLCCPTMPDGAPALGTPGRLTFTSPFNLLGWPALSLPAGRAASGLPLGTQLVGPPGGDGFLLAAALLFA